MKTKTCLPWLRAFCAFALLGLSGIVATPATAQESSWPSRPITLVVPFPPGGGTDVLARMLTSNLEKALNQTFVVDNKPGASGNIGAALVSRSEPNGQTFLLQATIIGVYPHVYKDIGYDPVTGLDPITTIAETPNIVVVRPDSPLQSFGDLLNKAKDAKAPLTFATAGTGSPQHMAMEVVADRAGAHMQHVPYKGTSPAIVDVIGGQVDAGVFSLSSTLPFVRSGKLKVLAVLSPERFPLIPDAPSIRELGFDGIDSAVRFLILSPPRTPAPIVKRMNEVIHNAVRSPEFEKMLEEAGYRGVLSTPEEARAMIRNEYDTWGPVVKRLGLNPS